MKEIIKEAKRLSKIHPRILSVFYSGRVKRLTNMCRELNVEARMQDHISPLAVANLNHYLYPLGQKCINEVMDPLLKDLCARHPRSHSTFSYARLQDSEGERYAPEVKEIELDLSLAFLVKSMITSVLADKIPEITTAQLAELKTEQQLDMKRLFDFFKFYLRKHNQVEILDFARSYMSENHYLDLSKIAIEPYCGPQYQTLFSIDSMIKDLPQELLTAEQKAFFQSVREDLKILKQNSTYTQNPELLSKLNHTAQTIELKVAEVKDSIEKSIEKNNQLVLRKYM